MLWTGKKNFSIRLENKIPFQTKDQLTFLGLEKYQNLEYLKCYTRWLRNYKANHIYHMFQK